MTRWQISVATLTLLGTLGCGTNPSPSRVSEKTLHVDGTGGSASEPTHFEKSDEQEEKIARWKERVKRHREEAKSVWDQMYEEGDSRCEWRGALHDKLPHLIDYLEDTEIPPRAPEYSSLINDEFPELDEIIDRRKLKTLREYHSFIKHTYPDFDKIINRRHTTADGMVGIVQWDDNDYARVMSGFCWTTRPDAIQLHRANEDAWVYEAILRALAHTNRKAGATSYDDAAIKRIITLQVGQPAAAVMLSAERSGLLQPKATVGGYGSMMSGYGHTEYGGSMGDYHAIKERGDIPIGPPIQASREEALRDARYVDASGEPLPGDPDPDAEFNLLPVHMVVVMSRANLPAFLTNLANSEMPVETKYVQIQERESASPETEAEESAALDVPLEILGTTRIYNPPPQPQ